MIVYLAFLLLVMPVVLLFSILFHRPARRKHLRIGLIGKKQGMTFWFHSLPETRGHPVSRFGCGKPVPTMLTILTVGFLISRMLKYDHRSRDIL